MEQQREGKLSVIIPCYNVESYIDRCLTSVLNQTIGQDRLEVICVDDASTDGTWEKLTQWEGRYPEQIIVIHCEENGAQGRARNIGLSYVSGAYLTFLDADDWMELDAYEKLVGALEQYDCDLAKCCWIRDNGTKQLKNRKLNEDYIMEINTVEERKQFLVSDVMGHIAVDKVYRADFIFEHQLRFLEGLKYEDIYWGVLCYYYARKVFFLEQVMYHYYVNPNSTVMKNNDRYHLDRFQVVNLLWQDCGKRGLLEQYYRESELNYLIYFYLNGLKMLILKFTEIPYEWFCKMCQTIRETVPDYQSNPYLTQVLDEISQLQIALIDQKLSQEEFSQLIQTLQQEAL